MTNKFYVGQKLKNHPFDEEPSFVIIQIFSKLTSDTKYYRVKDIDTDRIQVTTEEFLYPYWIAHNTGFFIYNYLKNIYKNYLQLY